MQVIASVLLDLVSNMKAFAGILIVSNWLAVSLGHSIHPSVCSLSFISVHQSSVSPLVEGLWCCLSTWLFIVCLLGFFVSVMASACPLAHHLSAFSIDPPPSRLHACLFTSSQLFRLCRLVCSIFSSACQWVCFLPACTSVCPLVFSFCLHVCSWDRLH